MPETWSKGEPVEHTGPDNVGGGMSCDMFVVLVTLILIGGYVLLTAMK
jgi:hypothetical protein